MILSFSQVQAGLCKTNRTCLSLVHQNLIQRAKMSFSQVNAYLWNQKLQSHTPSTLGDEGKLYLSVHLHTAIYMTKIIHIQTLQPPCLNGTKCFLVSSKISLNVLCANFLEKKKSVNHNVNDAKNFSAERLEMKAIVPKC